MLATSSHAADWKTDYDQALVASAQTKKPMLINFTGSDWCPPCIAMHKRVLSKPDFLEFAQKNVILLEIDLPRRRELPPQLMEQNYRLKQQFHVESLPVLVLANAEGKILGQVEGYAGETPSDVIGWLQKSIEKSSH